MKISSFYMNLDWMDCVLPGLCGVKEDKIYLTIKFHQFLSEALHLPTEYVDVCFTIPVAIICNSQYEL